MKRKSPRLKLVTPTARIKAPELPATFHPSDLMLNPAQTVFVSVSGNTLAGSLIDVLDGDLLLIDRTLTPYGGEIVAHGTMDDGLSVSYYEGPRLRDASLAPGDDDPIFGVASALIRVLR